MPQLLEKNPNIIPIEVDSKPIIKKRNDVQCWRAVAIMGVLLFHIWPEYFPNGFLGVDIFFVLSGYLMSKIIESKKSQMTFGLAINFYYRRIKRIVPIYVLFIIIVLILLMNTLWESEYRKVREDSKYALLFVTNQPSLFPVKNYFDVESNYDFFKHCWSISVEMQFYLIVPLIFCLWKNLFKQSKFIILIVLLMSSLTYQCMMKSEVTRYQSMFCRVWQFICGIFVQSYELNYFDYINSIFHNMIIQLILLICLIVEFFPLYEFNRELASIICVFITALLLSTSTSNENSPFRYLLMSQTLQKYFVFCGDISYVLYLTHWPLITYYRFIQYDLTFTIFRKLYVSGFWIRRKYHSQNHFR